MADLLYTLGLDSSGFIDAASKVIGMLGSLDLALGLLNKAANAAFAAFDEAAQFEKIEVAIGTITKSAEKTAGVMKDLKQLAAQTPFEMSDLAPAARALLGAGTAAGKVADQLRMLGDIAAGADTDVQGLVAVFNQVRGKGKLLTDDFIQLAERGVAGLREEIAKLKGVDVSAVADILSSGQVSAGDLEKIFQRMTSAGGIFFQAMQRQSQTFSGKLSSLSDAWTGLLVAFGRPVNDALKPLIEDVTKLVETMEPMFGSLGRGVGEVVTAAREFALQINKGLSGVAALAVAFGGLYEKIKAIAEVPFNAVMAAAPIMGEAIMTALRPIGNYLSQMLESAALSFGAAVTDVLGRVLQKTLVTEAMGHDLMAESFSLSTRSFAAKARAEDVAATIPAGFALAAEKMGGGLEVGWATLNKGAKDLNAKLQSIDEKKQQAKSLDELWRKAEDPGIQMTPGGMRIPVETGIGRGLSPEMIDALSRLSSEPPRRPDTALLTPPQSPGAANGAALSQGLQLLNQMIQPLLRMDSNLQRFAVI